MNELIGMHRFFGYQYAQDSVWVFDDEIPNVFSPGKTVTRHNRLIASIPPEGWDGLASIQDSMSVDGENAKALIRGLYAGKGGADMEEYFQKNPFRYDYIVEVIFYPENGVVYALSYEQSTYIRNKPINTYKYFMVLQEE